jgi:hypothetical protein
VSFILAPVMRYLRIWSVPKIVSALFSAALTLAAIGALGTTLVIQGRQLAEDLPKYENNLSAKIQGLGRAPIASGALERASGTLRDLRNELNRTENSAPSPSVAQDSAKPFPVHIEGLRFINVLLGDEPPLLPEERFYQRLLAGDATDAADQAEEELKTQSLSAYYDAIPMKALILAQADASDGKLTNEKQQAIRDTADEIIDVLSDYRDTNPMINDHVHRGEYFRGYFDGVRVDGQCSLRPQSQLAR